MKKVIAFDLDGTLTESKAPMPPKIGQLISQLLDKYQVCVMSGGKFEQFEEQMLDHLKASPKKLRNLHIMPTCGTRYYRYKDSQWRQVYAENFTPAQKRKIIEALNKGIDELGYREPKTWGEAIEDRDSQITFSALGQDVVEELGEEGIKKKAAWDPDGSKKRKLRDYLAERLPEFAVRVGGLTSVDITEPGIDKAYGLNKLMGILDVRKEDVLFIGDRLEIGGNDHPVKALGIDCIEVDDWHEAAKAIERILNSS